MFGDNEIVLPKAALNAVADAVIEGKYFATNSVEILIRAEDGKINIRELSAYLRLLDGIYGRLSFQSFRSYAQSPSSQLKINRVTFGSLEISLIFDLLNRPDIWRVVIMYLIIRTGPSVLRGEAIKNWAEAGKALVEAYLLVRPVESLRNHRFSRPQRSVIKRQIREDPMLSHLKENHIRQIINLMERVLAEENENLPAAARYSEKYVQDVQLRSGEE